jgi:hypothetical protein
MRRRFIKISAVALLTNLAAYGQSLGEIAREYREKQNAEQASGAQPKTPPKVITNKDLPANPEGYQAPREAQTSSASTETNFGKAADRSARRLEQQLLAEQRVGEQWKRQIVEQENRVAAIQARIDQIDASIRSGGVSAQGPYNRYQALQLEHAAQLQMHLDEQRRRLDAMQDAARRAGMHTAVYDP